MDRPTGMHSIWLVYHAIAFSDFRGSTALKLHAYYGDRGKKALLCKVAPITPPALD